MGFRYLFIIVAVLFGILAIATLVRMVIKIRSEQISTMNKRDLSSLLIFFVLFSYSLCRCIYAILVSVGVTSENVTSYEQNLVSSVPAGLYLTLQTAMLHKWSIHVKEMTHILRNDRFRLGGVLLTSSIGLLVACVALPLAAVIDLKTDSTPLFQPREWNFLLQLFFGITYIFNGGAFIFLGIYLRVLWSPEGQEAISASRRILSIALIFGLVCIIRGCVLLGYLRIRLLESGKFSKQSISRYGEPLIYIVEWVFVTISLAVLTSSVSRQNNQGSSGEETETSRSLQNRSLQTINNNSRHSHDFMSDMERGNSGRDINQLPHHNSAAQESLLSKSKRIFTSVVGVLGDPLPDGESTIYETSSTRLSNASGGGLRRTMSSDSVGSLSASSSQHPHRPKTQKKLKHVPSASSRRSMEAYAISGLEKQLPGSPAAMVGSPAAHSLGSISRRPRGVGGGSRRTLGYQQPAIINNSSTHPSGSVLAGSPSGSVPSQTSRLPPPPAAVPPSVSYGSEMDNTSSPIRRERTSGPREEE